MMVILLFWLSDKWRYRYFYTILDRTNEVLYSDYRQRRKSPRYATCIAEIDEAWIEHYGSCHRVVCRTPQQQYRFLFTRDRAQCDYLFSEIIKVMAQLKPL